MKISAIVPVYNTEKYVSRCIESIIEQTFADWELILVDDGSSDGSLNILRKYENEDPRIKVICQENAGPGIARNTGIKYASGEYIVFVDSDDRISNDYFEKLSRETADVVFIDIDQVDEDYHVISQEHMSTYKSLLKDDFLRSQMTGKILWGGVRKAVKSDLLSKNNIRFTDHQVGEEAIYSFLLLHYAASFSFIEGSVYEYVNRAGSQSDTKDDDPWGPVAIALREKVKQMRLYTEYANTINAFIATATIVSLDKMTGKYPAQPFRERARERIKKYQQENDKDYPVDLAHMPKKAKVLYLFLRLGWLFPIHTASRINRARR